MTAKRKSYTIILIALIIIFLSSCASTKNANENGVADYNKRIEIWKDVPFNSNDSKTDEMNINYNTNPLFSLISFFTAIDNAEYKDKEKAIDSYTYHKEIKPGYENETYTDEPYIIPYLVKDSDIAVIVIPGGGYGYKSMDGSTGEAKDIAIELNNHGINAFVLHYRSNPYEYPIPSLDLQRAIRYIKANFNKFNISPDKIALIGFSAGGNLIGTYINQIISKDYLPSEYRKDKIDIIDDSILAAAMIYPALTYEYNIPMLFASFNDEDVRNEKKRKELLELTDLSLNFNSKDIPQFISYGTKDNLVNSEGTLKYIEAAKLNNANILVIPAENQNHGFKPKYYMDEFVAWLKDLAKN